MKLLHKFGSYCLIIFVGIIFSYSFFLNNLLPIPSDTIIGLYHPFRDLYAKEYPNGIPYKNFLITDPVRQQYPWRNLVIQATEHTVFPLWNPYNFSGTPLLANIQSAVFYPGNLLFFVLPFAYAWSVLIIVQPMLAGSFMFLYLRNLKLHTYAAILGSISFAFSGFFVAWFEWGTVLHVALWLPLVLYSIDKILTTTKEKKLVVFYSLLLLFSLCASFFAGHIQTFFYLVLFAKLYLLIRWYQQKKLANIIPFILIGFFFVVLTWIQWYPTAQLILVSGRDIDQADWTKQGWFIPLQHSVQFLVPDFFGNPATLNYWSEWNYAEFVGYIGIVPMVMAVLALISRRDKKTLFFGTVLLISCLFAYATPLAKIPYLLSVPFLSTTQPTRLLFIIDFTLSVLGALGFDYFLKQKKAIMYPLGILSVLFVLLWVIIFKGQVLFPGITGENIMIAKRNMYLPTILFAVASSICLGAWYFHSKKYVVTTAAVFLIGITVFDLFRFSTKFNPYTPGKYLYPQTASIQFLQKDTSQFRIMTTDSQMLPPNFSSMYQLQSIDGYDPIYIKSYAQLIAASERGKADITPPFGFNRIITPHNYNSRIVDLLNVKYVISLSDITSPKLTKVFQEGNTRIYRNNTVFPRLFFVSEVLKKNSDQEVVETLFDTSINLQKVAITNDPVFYQAKTDFSIGQAKIITYADNEIIIETENTGKGFLVIADIFYPIWKATIDSKEKLDIIKTDHMLRGLMVPEGKHRIRLYTTLW